MEILTEIFNHTTSSYDVHMLSIMYLTNGGSSQDFINDPVALLSLALSHSGDRPLDFWFAKDERRSPHMGNGMTSSLIRSYKYWSISAHLWKSASFSIPVELFHLLFPIRGKLQALVDFEFKETFAKWDLAISADILDGAPLLRVESIMVSCSFDVERPMVTFIPRMLPKLTSFSDLRKQVGAYQELQEDLLDGENVLLVPTVIA